MSEFRLNDVLIIKPGDYVVVNMTAKPELIVCQYKKLSFTSSDV